MKAKLKNVVTFNCPLYKVGKNVNVRFPYLCCDVIYYESQRPSCVTSEANSSIVRFNRPANKIDQCFVFTLRLVQRTAVQVFVSLF